MRACFPRYIKCAFDIGSFQVGSIRKRYIEEDKYLRGRATAPWHTGRAVPRCRKQANIAEKKRRIIITPTCSKTTADDKQKQQKMAPLPVAPCTSDPDLSRRRPKEKLGAPDARKSRASAVTLNHNPWVGSGCGSFLLSLFL